MSFLIFAYRKLSLKRKINDLNFKVMMLSEQEQTKLTQIGDMQQAASRMSSIMTSNNSAQMGQINNNFMQQYYDRDSDNRYKLKDGFDASAANAAIWQANNDAMAKNSLFTGAFEAQNKAQMTVLNQQSTQISQEKSLIESQLKQLNGQLDGVEKAEDDAAKKDAPKFGLG